MSNPIYAKKGSVQIRTIEECSELIQAIAKAERFGWSKYNPYDRSMDNRQRVLAEIDDVQKACHELTLWISKQL